MTKLLYVIHFVVFWSLEWFEVYSHSWIFSPFFLETANWKCVCSITMQKSLYSLITSSNHFVFHICCCSFFMRKTLDRIDSIGNIFSFKIHWKLRRVWYFGSSFFIFGFVEPEAFQAQFIYFNKKQVVWPSKKVSTWDDWRRLYDFREILFWPMNKIQKNIFWDPFFV